MDSLINKDSRTSKISNLRTAKAEAPYHNRQVYLADRTGLGRAGMVQSIEREIDALLSALSGLPLN